MPSKTLPFIGVSNFRGTTSTADQYYSGCYLDKVDNAALQQSTYYVKGMKAFTASTSPTGPTSGAGTAILAWIGTGLSTPTATSDIVTAYGNTNSTIYLNDTSLGSITGQALHMAETSIGGTPNVTIVSSGNRGYYYPNAGALTEITDVDFPPKQTPALTISGNFIHMNGKAYIMCTTGQIFESDVNSLVNWTTNAYLTAQDSPDPGVGLAKVGRMVLAFGKTTIEFFQDTGNPAGSTLSRIDVKAIPSGVLNQHCILEAMNSVVWVGATGPQGPGVYVLEGYSAKKISNQSIDQMITPYSTNDLRLNKHVTTGHEFIFFTFDVGSISWMYDVKNNHWTIWPLLSPDFQKSSIGFKNGAATTFVISALTGTYRYEGSTYNEVNIVTSRFNAGTNNMKIWNSLRLVGDFSGSPAVNVSWSDDDYANFSTERSLTTTNPGTLLTRLGNSRERAFKFRYTPTQGTRFESIILEYDIAEQ